MTEIKILTPTGFQSFDGIQRYWHEEYLKFTFDDNSIVETAMDHRFIVNHKEVFSKNIRIGDNLGKVVKHIVKVSEGDYFYDPLNVKNGSIYSHDKNLVSHNSFLGTGDTLISAEILLSQKAREPIFRRDGINIYYGPEDKHNYVMTVDVAKGRNKDYSTFTIIDITCVPWKQVATYRNNAISPILFPDIIVKYARIFNEATVVIESNDAGQVVCNGVHYEYEYENMINESAIKEAGLGVLMTVKSKRMGCSAIKDIIDARRLIICDEETIIEMNTFVAKKNSYGASDGNHDDLMMNLVMFGFFAGSNTFQELTQVFLKDFLFQQKLLEIENDLPPFGFVDDGRLDEFEIMEEEGRRSIWSIGQ